MTAISRKMIKIAIVAAGTNASALTSSDWIEGEIKEYSQSGGAPDMNSEAVFGGFVDEDVPVSQIEVTMDVIPKINSEPNRWESFIYGLHSVGESYVSNKLAGKKAIFIQAESGSDFKTLAYNNARGTTFEPSHNADENRRVNFTFKLSPEDDGGITNFQAKAVAASTLPAWGVLVKE